VTLHDEGHWATYNDAQQGRDVRPLCKEVLALAGDGGGRTAVDFGCGLGKETRAMLSAGWRVHAIDGEPGTRERVLRTVDEADRPRLTVQTTRFADLTALPEADLVYAGFALPYVAPADFSRIWRLVLASLRPGALVAGNLFGVRDSWADDPLLTFLTETAARELFDGLEVLSFVEVDEDGQASTGPKHWHVFDVVARRHG